MFTCLLTWIAEPLADEVVRFAGGSHPLLLHPVHAHVVGHLLAHWVLRRLTHSCSRASQAVSRNVSKESFGKLSRKTWSAFMGVLEDIDAKLNRTELN